MKEKLYTIPLMDAFKAEDECPFCYIERQLEQHAMNFTLGPGASYMEDDVRAETDKTGFCKEHYRQMFVYGNRIGSSLIMETHLKKLSAELKQETMSANGYTKKHVPAFIELLKKGKGFCLPHFGDLLSGAENALSEKEFAQLREIIFPQMIENLDRLVEEVDWFQKKFDYQFKDADWKNSRDAVQRAMQKAGSGYPADPPFEQK